MVREYDMSMAMSMAQIIAKLIFEKIIFQNHIKAT